MTSIWTWMNEWRYELDGRFKFFFFVPCRNAFQRDPTEVWCILCAKGRKSDLRRQHLIDNLSCAWLVAVVLCHDYTSVDVSKSQLFYTPEARRCAPVSYLILMLFLLFSLLNNIWHICSLPRQMFLLWDLCWIKLQKNGWQSIVPCWHAPFPIGLLGSLSLGVVRRK